jgi:hypothetical protein
METIEKCKEIEIKDYRKYLFNRYTDKVIAVNIARINKPLSE